MPKAASLNIDLNEPAPLPAAATAPRTAKPKAQAEAPKNDTPVNFRWPAAEVKAMKKAALEADMTIQDFLLTCFHAFLQSKKG
jgi:predicted DNA binding CopG/RHH family protein